MQSRLAQAHRQLVRQALLPSASVAATAALAVSSLSHQVKSKSRDCGLDLAQAQRQLVRKALLPPASVAATAAGIASTSGVVTITSSNAGHKGASGLLSFSSGTASPGTSGSIAIGPGASTSGKAGALQISVGIGSSGSGGALLVASGESYCRRDV